MNLFRIKCGRQDRFSVRKARYLSNCLIDAGFVHAVHTSVRQPPAVVCARARPSQKVPPTADARKALYFPRTVHTQALDRGPPPCLYAYSEVREFRARAPPLFPFFGFAYHLFLTIFLNFTTSK